jgi:hypothetical protein
MKVVPLAQLREEDFGTFEHEFDQRDAALYALGIGETCAAQCCCDHKHEVATAYGSTDASRTVPGWRIASRDDAD